jgi:hypothetical protein
VYVTGIGEQLRGAREARGITIESAAADTRIARRFLDALESERWQDLPAPVYVRGFLRSYAGYLRLDPASLIGALPPSYSSQQANAPDPGTVSAPAPSPDPWRRTAPQGETPGAGNVGQAGFVLGTDPAEAAPPTFEAPVEPVAGADEWPDNGPDATIPAISPRMRGATPGTLAAAPARTRRSVPWPAVAIAGLALAALALAGYTLAGGGGGSSPPADKDGGATQAAGAGGSRTVIPPATSRTPTPGPGTPTAAGAAAGGAAATGTAAATSGTPGAATATASAGTPAPGASASVTSPAGTATVPPSPTQPQATSTPVPPTTTPTPVPPTPTPVWHPRGAAECEPSGVCGAVPYRVVCAPDGWFIDRPDVNGTFPAEEYGWPVREASSSGEASRVCG